MLKKPFKGINPNPPLSAEPLKPPRKGGFLVKGQKRDKKGTFRMSKINFKNLQIKRYSDKWFVQYYFRVPPELWEMYGPKEFIRFKVYEGLNYLKGDEKEKFANHLLKDVKEQLEAGFNPFSHLVVKKYTDEENAQSNKNNTPKLTNALSDFIKQKESKERSKSTIQSYLSYISKIEAYLIDTKQADILVSNLNDDFIIALMKYIESNYEIGATTYNNHIRFLVTLLKWFEAKPRGWVNFNSFNFGNDTELEKKTSKILKHKYFTNNIFEIVKKAMDQTPSLLFYAKFIYYSCMRPDEIRNLKIENIDLQSRVIRIIGKTGFRSVPICNELFEMLNKLDLQNHSLSDYVIGGNGLVANYQHSENYFSRVFRGLRKDLGLDDSFTLYGFKHTRVVHLLNAGYKDIEVMQLTGHRDTASYDKYKRDLTGNIDSKMTGNTIVF